MRNDIHVVSRSEKERDALDTRPKSKRSEEIAKKTEEFLAKGGKVKVFPSYYHQEPLNHRELNDLMWRRRMSEEK